MINLLEKYLKNANFSSEIQEFNDYFISHQDYPSLYAITDTFDVLGIENIAAKVPNEQFEQLPGQFLSFLTNSRQHQELVLITKGANVVNIEFEKEKRTIPTDEFLQLWDNIIVVIETGEVASKKEIITKNASFLYWIPLGALLLFFIFYADSNILNSTAHVLTLLGFLFSVFILQEKYGAETEFISKLCNFNETASCDSVIKSNVGKINAWLHISDLPILFFGTNLIALLFNFNTAGIIGLLSLMAVPFLLYFVWVQKTKIKKWCALCLIISLIIFIQAVVWIIFADSIQITLYDSGFYALAFILAATLWLFINPLLIENKKWQGENIALKRFKRNYAIFKSLEKPIVNESEYNYLQGIAIGNKEAPIVLGLFLSPSCGHCHTAFKKTIALVEKYPDKVQLKVMFNVNIDNQENPYVTVVKNLVELHKTSNEKGIAALQDWHLKRLSLSDWMKKWEQPIISIETEQHLRNQHQWCQSNELNYTPIAIVNNKISPQEYSLEELKYFISDIIEENSYKLTV